MLYIIGYTGEETELTLPSSFAYRGQTIYEYGIHDGAFTDKACITKLKISESVKFIGSYAFQNCTGISALTIPATVEYIAAGAFRGCSSLESINVEEGNDFYYSVDNCIIDASARTLLVACKNSVIPNDGSVVAIGEHAFDGCTGIETVVIPDSIEEIGDYAFFVCSSSYHSTFYAEGNWRVNTILDSETQSGLKNVIFEGQPQIRILGNSAFSYCESLTTFEPPSSLIVIGSSAFVACINLLENEDGIFYVGKWAVGYDYDYEYEHGYGITHISLREGTVGIADSAFSYCRSLVSVRLPSSITRISTGAFEDCSSLESVEIPSSVTMIDSYAFAWCSSLTSVVLKSNEVVSIGYDVFYDSPIEAIYVPASVVNAYKSNEDWKWEEYKSLIFPIEGGSVAPEIKYGDVDGNGEINATDVLILRKYMANYDYDTNTSTVEVAAGADADGNGKADATDVLLLRKYMANYNFDTGSSSVVLGPQN